MAIIVEHKLNVSEILALDGSSRLDFSGSDTIINAPSGGDVRYVIDGVEKLRIDAAAALFAIVGGTQADTSLNFRHQVTDFTTNSGVGTATASNSRPADAFILGVTFDIITVLAGAGLTTFSLGDGSDPDLYGSGFAIAEGTINDMTDYTANPFEYRTTLGDIVLTAAAGQFDSGSIRLTVHFIDLTQTT